MCAMSTLDWSQSKIFLVYNEIRGLEFLQMLDKMCFSCSEMLKSGKIWAEYLLSNCISLQTFWMTLIAVWFEGTRCVYDKLVRLCRDRVVWLVLRPLCVMRTRCLSRTTGVSTFTTRMESFSRTSVRVVCAAHTVRPIPIILLKRWWDLVWAVYRR